MGLARGVGSGEKVGVVARVLVGVDIDIHGDQHAVDGKLVVITARAFTDVDCFAGRGDVGGIPGGKSDLVGVDALANDPVVLRDEADTIDSVGGVAWRPGGCGFERRSIESPCRSGKWLL